MEKFIFCKDYKEQPSLRDSFNQLAAETFGGLHFEKWYEHGYWDHRYIPYSYAVDGKIIANVSVNFLDFIIDGAKKKAIQIGTVMTHPDYRGKGLAASLMNKVIEEYEEECDFLYLFANDSVLDFYPKFGFVKVEEARFTVDALPSKASNVKKLDVQNEAHRNLMYKMAAERIATSAKLNVVNTPSLFMFYALYVFSENIYWIEEEELIIVFEEEVETIEVYDIVSNHPIDHAEALMYIPNRDNKPLQLHFTPDQSVEAHATIDGSTHLFVRAKGDFTYPSHVLHPITAKA